MVSRSVGGGQYFGVVKVGSNLGQGKMAYPDHPKAL